MQERLEWRQADVASVVLTVPRKSEEYELVRGRALELMAWSAMCPGGRANRRQSSRSLETHQLSGSNAMGSRASNGLMESFGVGTQIMDYYSK